MSLLDLNPDALLTTTRTVRKRLDFSRPVPAELIRECLEIAVQAPTGGNSQTWSFVVVTDAAKRQALGEIYRKGYETYRNANYRPSNRVQANPELLATQMKVMDSADYLAEHIHEAPVLLIPCILGRLDSAGLIQQAGTWGSILPAVWSFMLAARARSLGTAWTTIHLYHEEEAAELLGIPFARVTQAAMIPVAYTVGTEFNAAKRKPLDDIVHMDQW